MNDHLVYLGIGSNVGDSFAILKKAFLELANLPGIHHLETSRLYQTTPVSNLPQRDYINAVCQLRTALSLPALFEQLQNIEKRLGKLPKEKNAPRKIDIDILFFGQTYYSSPVLTVPHPRWKQRLFVLIPLWDLTDSITYPINDRGQTETLALKDFLATFPNIHQESVFPLNKTT